MPAMQGNIEWAVEALGATQGAGRRGWLKAAQDEAAARLSQTGMPGRRDEYWRYTRGEQFHVDPPELGHDMATDAFDAHKPVKLVFRGGEFDPTASDPLALEGCEISVLSEAAETDIHWVSGVYGKLERLGQDPVARPFAAMNTARATDGLLLRVTGKVERPIAIKYLEAELPRPRLHHVIELADGASATILETGALAPQYNTVIEAVLGKGAELNHVRLQGAGAHRLAVTGMFASLAADASFKSFTLSLQGQVTRNEAVITFNGDDARAHIAGASLGAGKTHHDDTVFITHDAVNCESRQVFKKVLQNGATGVFQGKILVQPDAQKTDGYQISQGLLLDEDSNFLAKPELEIYADDVACSHGSTCGAPDETAMFYLMSRGVRRQDAEDMLILAFVDDAIAEIENEAIAETVRTVLGSQVKAYRDA